MLIGLLGASIETVYIEEQDEGRRSLIHHVLIHFYSRINSSDSFINERMIDLYSRKFSAEEANAGQGPSISREVSHKNDEDTMALVKAYISLYSEKSELQMTGFLTVLKYGWEGDPSASGVAVGFLGVNDFHHIDELAVRYMNELDDIKKMMLFSAMVTVYEKQGYSSEESMKFIRDFSAT